MEYIVNKKKVYVHTGNQVINSEQNTMMFIHGTGCDHTIWQPFGRYFAHHGYNVLSVDMPGHGRSEGEPLATVEDMAVWVLALIDTVDVREIALVGHSLGALVALQATADDKKGKVRKLIMLGAAFPMEVGEPLLEAAKNNDHNVIDMLNIYGHSYRSRLGANPAPGISCFNVCMRLMEMSRPGVIYTDLNACNEYGNGLEACAQVKCPVTIIAGDSDLLTPRPATMTVFEALKDADLVTIKDCGHMMFTEQPEATHRALVKAMKF